MDWISAKFDGVRSTGHELSDGKHRQRTARLALAWRQVGDALAGDVARFNARSTRRVVIEIQREYIRVDWESADGGLLLLVRSSEPGESVITYSAPGQQPDKWLHHGGTITPRAKGLYQIRDSLNSTKIVDVYEMSELLLGPPLFGEWPIV